MFGITFDSKHEAERYLVLRADEIAGRISELRCQVPFELIPPQLHGKWRATTYIADFTYMDSEGQFVVEDAKGFKTEVYRIKKKLMLLKHGVVVREV